MALRVEFTKKQTIITMKIETMEIIAERLSSMEDLYFPRSLQSTTMVSSQRKSLLLTLLSHDPAVFLERYGSQLTCGELGEFDAFIDDYEINWHLKRLRSSMSPTSEELRLKAAMVKNRRRAYMNKLIRDEQYFSEDSMREREPYLHHEYVGKFQDPSGRRMARPGERWSETLMRRTEEAILVAKIRGEQQRLGVAERDWVGNERPREEEEEQEEEEDDDDIAEEANGHSAEIESDTRSATNNSQFAAVIPIEKLSISTEVMQDQMDQFTHIMQEKFLAGEDHLYMDYSEIDADETLDDHWSREANNDAEEKYFAED